MLTNYVYYRADIQPTTLQPPGPIYHSFPCHSWLRGVVLLREVHWLGMAGTVYEQFSKRNFSNLMERGRTPLDKSGPIDERRMEGLRWPDFTLCFSDGWLIAVGLLHS